MKYLEFRRHSERSEESPEVLTAFHIRGILRSLSLSQNDVLSAAFAGLGLPLAYSLIEPHLLTVRHFDVTLPGLPVAAENWRLVQISDVHYSAIGGARLLEETVERSNSLNPDAVLLTGDYVSRRNSYASFTGARLWARPIMDYADAMAKVLSGLRARLGIIAVAGNHDHAKGRCDAIEGLLAKAGVVSLRNKSTFLDGVLPLAGLDDLRGGRPLVRQALKGIDAAMPQIILSHNPRLMLELRHRNALILSGHTHGGQVHLPFTNLRVRPRDVVQTPFLRGWYRQSPAQMYVSSGLGSVHFPMRFRCPPEMVVFTLRG
jgi:predicted MPP superfamily phosphohydrolase